MLSYTAQQVKKIIREEEARIREFKIKEQIIAVNIAIETMIEHTSRKMFIDNYQISDLDEKVVDELRQNGFKLTDFSESTKGFWIEV